MCVYACVFSSVQVSPIAQSCSTLRPHRLQIAKLPCPSPSPRAHSNSCPQSQCCHPTVPSSLTPFSSCPQSFPASGCFPMSRLFASGGQSIGASASLSVLPMDIQDSFHLGLTSFNSLQSEELLSLLQHRRSKASILWYSPFFVVLEQVFLKLSPHQLVY